MSSSARSLVAILPASARPGTRSIFTAAEAVESIFSVITTFPVLQGTWQLHRCCYAPAVVQSAFEFATRYLSSGHQRLLVSDVLLFALLAFVVLAPPLVLLR
jgi:hypothetical protein